MKDASNSFFNLISSQSQSQGPFSDHWLSDQSPFRSAIQPSLLNVTSFSIILMYALHTTERALIKVLNDLLLADNSGHFESSLIWILILTQLIILLYLTVLRNGLASGALLLIVFVPIFPIDVSVAKDTAPSLMVFLKGRSWVPCFLKFIRFLWGHHLIFGVSILYTIHFILYTIHRGLLPWRLHYILYKKYYTW